MKKIAILILFLVPGLVFAGGVEFYYNGKLITTFYYEKATSYSSVLVTTDTTTKGKLLVNIEENYNRNGQYFDTRMNKTISFSKASNARMFQLVSEYGFSPSLVNLLYYAISLPDSSYYGSLTLYPSGGDALFAITFDQDLNLITKR
jgi:hypothetical protein